MTSKVNFGPVGANIQAARKLAGKTQKEVAAVCDCDFKHISAVENDRSKPSLELLMILSDELDVPVDYFLKGSSHTSTSYYIEEEFTQRIRKMNAGTRNALLKIMDQLLEVQDANSSAL